MKGLILLILGCGCFRAPACDLCAIYRAADARGESGVGLVFSLAEQFIPYRTSQLGSEVVHPVNPDHLLSSVTHIVVGYNPSSRFGLSLNVPLTHLSFQRTDLNYSLAAPPVIYTEQGEEAGLGDLSLIGRIAVLQKSEMQYGFVVNLLAGVKFPTGDDQRLREEMAQTEIFNALLPPGTPHDPLGHSISSVHQHSLALGSGAYDGIFGLTANANWRRTFFNAQLQYYLRSEGQTGFRFGNEMMISGGPGVFVILDESYTVGLQVFVLYDVLAQDELGGIASNRTGSTSWYLGPLVTATWRSHFSANFGVDLPLHVAAQGYQSVPDFRVHGGLSWRF